MKNVRKSFLNKVSWTLASNIIYAATQFFILSAIAKIGGVEEVGIFTLALAICSPVFLFLNLKLRSIILTDQENQNSFSEFFYLREYTGYLGILFVAVIGWLLNLDLYIYVSLLILALSKFFEMKIDLFIGYYQKSKRYDVAAKSIILRGTSSLISVVIIYFYTRNMVFVMASMLISNLIFYYFYDKRIIEKTLLLNHRKRPKFKKLNKLFVFALPLGISTVIGSLSTSFPRMIIENKLGLYELGIFSGLSYLLVIGGTFLSAISPVVTPKLASYGSNHDFAAFASLLKKLVFFGFLVALMLNVTFAFFGKEIISIVFSEEYAKHYKVLMIIVFGVTFLYSSVFLGTALTALRVFKFQPLINGLGLIALVISSFLLIDKFQLIGMAYAVVINYFVVSIGYLSAIIFVIKSMKEKKNVKNTTVSFKEI